MSKIISDKDFKSEVKDFQGVVLVDFWATWCTPCKIQGPIIDKLADKYKDNDAVKITKLDVDESPDTAFEFSIRSIPTLGIFKNGQLVETMVGLRPEGDIAAAIERNMR